MSVDSIIQHPHGTFVAGTAALPGLYIVNDRDTGLFSPAANMLGVVTGGVERARFDTDGGLVIGDGTITAKDGGGIGVHVHIASAGAVAANAALDQFILESNTTVGFMILIPDAATGYYAFGSIGDTLAASLNWQFSTKELQLTTRTVGGVIVLKVANASEAMRLQADGSVRLSAGTAALATGAVGPFPGIPTMAGNASGTPTNESAGQAPIVYDTTNQELKVWDPITNAWRAIVTAAQ